MRHQSVVNNLKILHVNILTLFASRRSARSGMLYENLGSIEIFAYNKI